MDSLLRTSLFLGMFTAASGQGLQDNSFTLRNPGGNPFLENLTSADGVLMVSANGTLFRSLDLGISWQPFPLPPDLSPFPPPLRFDPTAGLLYATGFGGTYTASPRAAGWTLLSGFRPSFDAYSIDGATFASNGSPGEGINISLDGGRTWRTTDRFQASGGGGTPFAAGTCVYVAGVDVPISVSCDGGVTWKSPIGDAWSVSARAMVRHESAVIALAERGLVRSADSGKTWARWRGNLTGDSLFQELILSGSSLFVSSGTSAHRSADGGRSWVALSSPEPGLQAPVFNQGLAEAEGTLFTLSRKGLASSANGGGTWSLVEFHSMATPIHSLALQGNRILARAEEGIFVSRDSGVSWEASLPAVANHPWTAFAGSGSLFAAGSHDGTVRISSDAGAGWTRPYPLPIPTPVVGLAAFGGSILAVSGGALWRLSASDSTWSTVPLPATDSIRFLASRPDVLLLIGASRLRELRPDGFSADRSAGIAIGMVMGAWIVEDRLFAYTTDGFLHQWNPGEASWRRLPSPFDRHVISMVGTGNVIMAATYMGTFASTDGGGNWSPISSSSQEIKALACDEEYLYAGDGRGGVWRMRLDPATTSIRSYGRRNQPGAQARFPPGDFRESRWRPDGRWKGR